MDVNIHLIVSETNLVGFIVLIVHAASKKSRTLNVVENFGFDI